MTSDDTIHPEGREQQPARPTIEVGWVRVDRMDEPDSRALVGARDHLLETMRVALPQFEWRMPIKDAEVPRAGERVSIVSLLDVGATELDAMHWDMAFVFTDDDLESHYRPYCFAAPSSTLSVAAVSTNRIDPRATGSRVSTHERIEIMSQRLFALAAHMLGELIGLDHSSQPHDLMFDLSEVTDLDAMSRFSPAALELLREELDDIADVRLEEQTLASRWSRLGFFLRALWHERDMVLLAVRQARPWQFPFRFTRLLAAAFSTLLILSITAEAWDLGMGQPPWLVGALSLGAVLLVSRYLLHRQGVLGRRAEGGGELRVVAQASVALSLFLGMVTTYVVLFGSTVFIAQVFFRPRLLEQWAASIEGPLGLEHTLVFAGFVSSLGILLSALGASFEEQTYFPSRGARRRGDLSQRLVLRSVRSTHRPLTRLGKKGPEATLV